VVHFDADPWNASAFMKRRQAFFAFLSRTGLLEALSEKGQIFLLAPAFAGSLARGAEFFK
jgi:hypothetical protein